MPYTIYEPPPGPCPYARMLLEYAEAAERADARRKILLARITDLQAQSIPGDTDVLRRRADLLMTEIREIRAAMKIIRRYVDRF